MNAIVLILSVVLPIVPVILFPTRFIGRGPVRTIVGAGMLVGMMMVLYFGLAAATGEGGPGAIGTVGAAELPGISDADVSALADLLK